MSHKYVDFGTRGAAADAVGGRSKVRFFREYFCRVPDHVDQMVWTLVTAKYDCRLGIVVFGLVWECHSSARK